MLDSGRCVEQQQQMQAGVGLLILDMMPIYMIIVLDIIIIICFSINCPTVICLPTVAIFSREATSEIYGPRGLFSIIYFQIHIANCLFFYFLLLFSDLYYQKPKNTLLHFIHFYLHLSIYYNFILSLRHFLALLPERD